MWRNVRWCLLTGQWNCRVINGVIITTVSDEHWSRTGFLMQHWDVTAASQKTKKKNSKRWKAKWKWKWGCEKKRQTETSKIETEIFAVGKPRAGRCQDPLVKSHSQTGAEIRDGDWLPERCVCDRRSGSWDGGWWDLNETGWSPLWPFDTVMQRRWLMCRRLPPLQLVVTSQWRTDVVTDWSVNGDYAPDLNTLLIPSLSL